MTTRLRDLIRSVRQTKTAQQERDVISKEAAALRQAFKEQDGTYRHRNVAKLMFMHMLGYPTHFGQMETLKLIASNGFPEKRIGYLGLMILLDERQEVLMLVTNSLKNDLNSRNQYIVGLALTALGNICSAEMARDLAPEVEKLLGSTNPYVRKKAALCARRVMRKVPDMLESFVDRSAELLNDGNHAVVLAGVTLMLEIADMEPATLAIFREQVPLLCRTLRALLMGGFSAEYDVGGIADPYLQVKILRLLRVLGHGSAEASDAMSDVLAQVATNTEGARSAGNAILYECVRTIMAVESIGGLRVLAVNTLGRFLAHRDNNIRYVALNTLARVVSVDAQAVQRHRATIVDCVKDSDASIRRKALELVYALINEGNVKALTSELLEYLRSCDQEFRADLADKVCKLVQQYAPDKRWYVDSMVRVLTEAGIYVKEEACRGLITVVLNAGQLHGYATRVLYKALRTQGEAAAPALVSVAVWCVGEYGDLAVSGAGRLEGEPAGGVATEAELLEALTEVLARVELPGECREYALTSLIKLSARCPGTTPVVAAVLEEHASAVPLEEQSRSVEFGRLFSHDAIRSQVLEPMPALEETAYDATLDAMDDGGAAAGGDAAAAAAVDLAALLGLDVGIAETAGGAEAAAAPAPAGGMSALHDLLAVSTPVSSPQAQASVPSFTAYSNDAVEITFAPSHGAAPGLTDILAEFKNKTAAPIIGFTLQAAVPKVFQLKLDPASSTMLPAGGSATQMIHVTNSPPGQKSLAMRLRVSYTVSGQQVVQQAEVSNFPAGF